MKANLLNDIQVKNAQPLDKMYRLSDGERLYLQVEPDLKSWVFRYRRPVTKKENMLVLGHYPATSLKKAREKKTEYNGYLDQGIDPADKVAEEELSREAEARTFDVIADFWLEKFCKPEVSERHYNKTMERLFNHVRPHIGKVPVQTLNTKHFLSVLRILNKAGKYSTANIILGLCTKICQYAVIEEWMEINPCRELDGFIPSPESENFPALTDPREVGQLLVNIDNFQKCSPFVHLQLRIAPYVFLRPTELREGLWQEIDFANAVWRIPKERMKKKREHIVPLSRQVLEMLAQLRQLSGHGPLLFPGKKKQFTSSATCGRALDRMGYHGKHCMHGFRSTASTLLNELGYHPDWVEKQLAHKPRNKTRAAYNKAQYLSERTRMMQEWADYLDELRRQALASQLRQLIARTPAPVTAWATAGDLCDDTMQDAV